MVSRLVKRETNRLMQLHGSLKLGEIRTDRFSRVYIDRKHKLLYNRIAKNANSAILSYFYSLSNQNEVANAEAERESAKASLPHLDRVFVTDLLDDYRRLVVLREPKSRILSSFLDKFRQDSAFSRKYRKFDLTPAGFEAFLNWLNDGNLNSDRHWDLQVNALAFPLSYFTDVIDVGEVNTKLPLLLDAVGLDGSAFLTHRNAKLGNMHATNSDGKMAEFWNKRTNRLAEKLYENDLEIYASTFSDISQT